MPRPLWLCSLALVLLPGPARPADADRPLTRIAFGSCADQEKPQPVWEAVLAQKPGLFVFLGDAMYADLRYKGVPDPERIAACYQKLGEVPGFRKLRAACPVMAVWDDHDYGKNDAGAEFPHKAASQKLLLDFFGEPTDSPRRRRAGVYDAKVFGPPGQRVQVILLDGRYHRSPLKKGKGNAYVPNLDAGATILGEEQWKWLGEQLKVPAELRLIGSGIQVVAEDHGFEKWANFPRERERLFQLIRDTGAAGVVFLSGDRHLAELSMADVGVGYPMLDLTSSGLNQGAKAWRPAERNRHRVATMTWGDNFGLVTVDWDATPPRVSLQIRDDAGEVALQHKLPLSALQPRQVAAEGPVGPGAVTPAAAAKRVGAKLTVEFVVKATGASRDKKRAFLNSEANFRDEANFTVILEMKDAEAWKAVKPDDYTGRRVRVTGTVSRFQERPQIVVDDPKQVVIVGPKAPE